MKHRAQADEDEAIGLDRALTVAAVDKEQLVKSLRAEAAGEIEQRELAARAVLEASRAQAAAGVCICLLYVSVQPLRRRRFPGAHRLRRLYRAQPPLAPPSSFR